MKRASSDILFSASVKAVQAERGSRDAFERNEREKGGFRGDVDEILLAFLAEVDTAYLATASADGQPYVQHRGGPRGFIRALDERTLGFIDYNGNKQYVSTGNLRENQRVCLFLMDYLQKRRVKVFGTARHVPLSPELVAKLDAGDPENTPESVLLIDVAAWDVNCGQHIPQKVNAADVAPVIEELRTRIAALEAELAKR